MPVAGVQFDCYGAEFFRLLLKRQKNLSAIVWWSEVVKYQLPVNFFEQCPAFFEMSHRRAADYTDDILWHGGLGSELQRPPAVKT